MWLQKSYWGELEDSSALPQIVVQMLHPVSMVVFSPEVCRKATSIPDMTSFLVTILYDLLPHVGKEFVSLAPGKQSHLL